MSKKWFFLFCFIGFSLTIAAQSFTYKNIKGRVYSEGGDLAAIHVHNSTAKNATITDVNGYFIISASLNDTLVFSAVQYKKKQIVVTIQVLNEPIVPVFLNAVINQLDEVIVTPYNLTGDITKDISFLKIKPVVTSSTLGLPNAYVLPISKDKRELHAATANSLMSFDPLINAITGRTKMLKNRVKRNAKYALTQQVRAFYDDSLIVSVLNIPKLKIADFMYFCEVDIYFSAVVDTRNRLKIWEFMQKKSLVYREYNSLD